MKMSDFFENLVEMLKEKNMSVKELEEKCILTKNTFYDYKEFLPSLKNAINLANFLEVSLDYLLGNTDKNNFKRYKTEQNIYPKLTALMKVNNITQTNLCKELQISRTNFSRWKNGITPKFSTLIRLAEILGCDINQFLDFEE